MNVCVIPARGGSKRIPRKNIREFCGRPMIHWSIKAALDSGLFAHVLVSTDDQEIAAVANAHGAEVPFLRPTELADDRAGTVEAVAHAADWAAQRYGNVEALCCIYATAPFVSRGDLQKARRLLDEGEWAYVFAAARFPAPVHRGFTRGHDGAMQMLFLEHAATRSQDLPPVYHDAGQFYWARLDTWRKRQSIFGAQSTFVELPPWRVQDIDTLEDWVMAQHLFELLKRTTDGR